MARLHSKAVDFAFDSVQLEDELSQVRIRFDVPESDITSFADTWQNYLPGKPTATIDIEGAFDAATGAGDITIFGELGEDAEEWDWEHDGTYGYDGFANVVSYEIVSSVNDAIKYSASFRHNGGAAAADAAAPTRSAA